MSKDLVARAEKHIRDLRLAGGRDFAVSGYEDGPIVDQDMRQSLLNAADVLEEALQEISRLKKCAL